MSVFNVTNDMEKNRLIKSKDHEEPFYWDGQAFVNLGRTLVFDAIRSDGDYFIVPVYVGESGLAINKLTVK